MKRAFYLIGLLALLGALAACSGSEPDSTPTATATAVVATATPTATATAVVATATPTEAAEACAELTLVVGSVTLEYLGPFEPGSNDDFWQRGVLVSPQINPRSTILSFQTNNLDLEQFWGPEVAFEESLQYRSFVKDADGNKIPDVVALINQQLDPSVLYLLVPPNTMLGGCYQAGLDLAEGTIAVGFEAP